MRVAIRRAFSENATLEPSQTVTKRKRVLLLDAQEGQLPLQLGWTDEFIVFIFSSIFMTSRGRAEARGCSKRKREKIVQFFFPLRSRGQQAGRQA